MSSNRIYLNWDQKMALYEAMKSDRANLETTHDSYADIADKLGVKLGFPISETTVKRMYKSLNYRKVATGGRRGSISQMNAAKKRKRQEREQLREDVNVVAFTLYRVARQVFGESNPTTETLSDLVTRGAGNIRTENEDASALEQVNNS